MTECAHTPSTRANGKPEACAVGLCDFAEQHVQGVFELHEAVFPVRYTKSLIASMLGPNNVAIVAVAHEPLDGLEALEVTQERVVGFISARLQECDDFCGLLFHRKQVCLSQSAAPLPQLLQLCTTRCAFLCGFDDAG